jgi:hypothetical protein
VARTANEQGKITVRKSDSVANWTYFNLMQSSKCEFSTNSWPKFAQAAVNPLRRLRGDLRNNLDVVARLEICLDDRGR